VQVTTFVGLDVHKPWINVAALLPGHDTPIEWRIANETQAIRKMLKRVASLTAGDVRYCYEAGPCGYALQRQIISWSEASCMLVAPRSSHASPASASRPIAVTPRGSPFSSAPDCSPRSTLSLRRTKRLETSPERARPA